jgi:hypothetical protein
VRHGRRRTSSVRPGRVASGGADLYARRSHGVGGYRRPSIPDGLYLVPIMESMQEPANGLRRTPLLETV